VSQPERSSLGTARGRTFISLAKLNNHCSSFGILKPVPGRNSESEYQLDVCSLSSERKTACALWARSEKRTTAASLSVGCCCSSCRQRLLYAPQHALCA